MREITSKILHRDYQLFVSFPLSYQDRQTAKFPVLFVTDANYAFPVVRSTARRVGDHGNGLEDFVLIGLSYARGDTPEYSRRRDYTPTAHGDRDAISDMPGRPPLYGEAELYRQFIATEVFPLVERSYRVDMHRKIYAGHSYGGLLGTYILLTTPDMFQNYIISSPSLWFDHKAISLRENDYAAAHQDLAANVYLVVGGYETIDATSHDKRYNETEDLVRDMRAFEQQLRARRYASLHMESAVVADEDHLSVFPSSITRGLRWALPPVR